MSKKTLIIVVALITLFLLGLGYNHLTAGGDFNRTTILKNATYSNNIENLDMRDGKLMLTYGIGERNYSNSNKSYYPVIITKVSEKDLENYTKLENDGTFKGEFLIKGVNSEPMHDWLFGETWVIAEVSGVIDHNDVYFHMEQQRFYDEKVPFVVRHTVSGNAVLTEYHPSIIQYAFIIFMVICLLLFAAFFSATP